MHPGAEDYVRATQLQSNWLQIMQRTKRLTFFTAGYSQLSIIFPYIVVSPAYFAGKVQLGVFALTSLYFAGISLWRTFVPGDKSETDHGQETH